MKNIEQLLNKENWIKYLELADEDGITNHGIAQDIVSKIQQAINYIPCCTELKDKNDEFSEFVNNYCLERLDGDYIYNGSTYDLVGLKKVFDINKQ